MRNKKPQTITQMKGGINKMKTGILIIALLMTSIFAGTLTIGMENVIVKSKDNLYKADLIESKKAIQYELATDLENPSPTPKEEGSTITWGINCNIVDRGDANVDGNVDISDVIYINMYLQGEVKLQCEERADVNGDGKINELDRDYLNAYLFEGGPAPGNAGVKPVPIIKPDTGSSKPIELKDFEIEVPQMDKEESIDEVKTFDEKRKLGFTESWTGTGSINNGEKGFLVSTFWAIQKFVEENNDIVEKVSGNLKIQSSTNYHLFLIERDDNSLTFSVSSDSSDKNTIGKLILTKKNEFIGLTTWTGTLTLKSGSLPGTWNIELFTTNHVVRPTTSSTGTGSGVSIPSVCKDLKGDANNDGIVDISDAVYISLYLNGERKLQCKDNADVNSDGSINEKDREFLLNYLFLGGESPYRTVRACDETSLGDVNGDGKVNSADAVNINLYLQGDHKLACLENADFNKDGKVTIEDSESILNWLFDEERTTVMKASGEGTGIAQAKQQPQINGFWAKVKRFFLG